MGFLSKITKPVTKMLGTGLGVLGLGGSIKEGSKGQAEPRKRYKRRKRMRYVSKRRKTFESKQKIGRKTSTKLLSSGIGRSKNKGRISTLISQLSNRPDTTSLRGRNAGTSSRGKNGKQIGSEFKRGRGKNNGRR